MPKSKASQDFVPVREIRDGVVILKDGTLRSVVMTASLNLALKAEDEHNAIVMQFQNFLNSLDFSVQIIVQSRELNILPYINRLEKRVDEQEEELLRIQTKEYVDFIRWFSDSVNIMTKNFYLVIPYGAGGIASSDSKSGGLLSKLTGGGSSQSTAQSERFEEQKNQLEQRVAVVQQGLNAMGLRNVLLETQQLIELYYGTFNPGEPQKNTGLDTDAKTYSKNV